MLEVDRCRRSAIRRPGRRWRAGGATRRWSISRRARPASQSPPPSTLPAHAAAFAEAAQLGLPARTAASVGSVADGRAAGVRPRCGRRRPAPSSRRRRSRCCRCGPRSSERCSTRARRRPTSPPASPTGSSPPSGPPAFVAANDYPDGDPRLVPVGAGARPGRRLACGYTGRGPDLGLIQVPLTVTPVSPAPGWWTSGPPAPLGSSSAARRPRPSMASSRCMEMSWTTMSSRPFSLVPSSSMM